MTNAQDTALYSIGNAIGHRNLKAGTRTLDEIGDLHVVWRRGGYEVVLGIAPGGELTILCGSGGEITELSVGDLAAWFP